jgi:hypothetical protein
MELLFLFLFLGDFKNGPNQLIVFGLVEQEVQIVKVLNSLENFTYLVLGVLILTLVANKFVEGLKGNLVIFEEFRWLFLGIG